MRNPGRLAILLNGIVISTLNACGGVSVADAPGVGGQGGGGDSPVGGLAGSSESGGHGQELGGTSGVSAAGSAGTPSGGGGASGGAGGSVGKASTPVCDEQGLLQLVEGLNLIAPVDYLGVYLYQGQGQATIYQAMGTLCSGASDKARCEAAMSSGAPSAGFTKPNLYPPVLSTTPAYLYMYLAYSRGDSVGFVENHQQLDAFLGEIDTINEAGLVFFNQGVRAPCYAISEFPDSYVYSTQTAYMGCTIGPQGYSFSVTRAGMVSSTPIGMSMPCAGRRPTGLVSERGASRSPLGDYYAYLAHLEGAAVLAFDVMERELTRFGAPPALQLRARRARADEQRHHRSMAALARREGVAVPRVRAVPQEDRSLLAAALENAVEGCVREAWGALSAHYQAAMVCEPEARRLWQGIAVDESEHAELSLALHDWFMLQLAVEERELVEAAMQRARLELRLELTGGAAPHPAIAHQAGVPDPARAAVLFGELERQLLAAVVTRAA